MCQVEGGWDVAVHAGRMQSEPPFRPDIGNDISIEMQSSPVMSVASSLHMFVRNNITLVGD
jgi:hypothetical protein